MLKKQPTKKDVIDNIQVKLFSPEFKSSKAGCIMLVCNFLKCLIIYRMCLNVGFLHDCLERWAISAHLVIFF